MQVLNIESNNKKFLILTAEIEKVLPIPPSFLIDFTQGKVPRSMVVDNQVCRIEGLEGELCKDTMEILRGSRLVQSSKDKRLLVFCDLVVGIMQIEGEYQPTLVIDGQAYQLINMSSRAGKGEN